MLHGVFWNLFLAAIPVALGYLLTWVLDLQQKKKALVLLAVPVGLAWLVFLPNTCYLLTEWRHLLFDARWEELLDRAHVDRNAMLRVAAWSLWFLVYSGAGVLLFALSIRPVERWLRSRKASTVVFAPFFFTLVSLGVYLGLIKRYNSWDLVQKPLTIWNSVLDALTTVPLLTAILVFAAILWMLYEAVDLWADGVSDRLRSWGLLGRGGGKKKGKK